MIHMVLVAAAGGAQLLLRATTGPTACKAATLPWAAFMLHCHDLISMIAGPAGHAADRMARAALSLSKRRSSQVVLLTHAVPRSPRWLASSAGQRLASSVALSGFDLFGVHIAVA